MKTLFELSGKFLAQLIDRQTCAWKKDPVTIQNKTLEKLLKKGRHTLFGRDHEFGKIKNHSDFIKKVPLRDYEAFSNYINRIKKGDKDVLWPGRPIYLCKTSGTTSGVKYIPLTKDSLPNHINSARNALLNYIKITGNTSFINGKMIFIQGSPVLDSEGGIPTGRLSGIVAHHVPKYLQKKRLPSYSTNSIEDWEKKVDTIVDETIKENMTLIGGIPSWIQMYFEKLQERSGGKTIREIFPNLQLMVLGGVNFEPYEKRFRQLT
ncbi:MAG: GH3 auxin-responsive promoter family protein, partial [Bacteroidales bacterium]|nr:GH3 auxin-responsive promoter family protein [Bacteroidales bacterium]